MPQFLLGFFSKFLMRATSFSYGSCPTPPPFLGINSLIIIIIIVIMEDTIEKVATKANDNEQYSRHQNVRVMGFVEEEDCAEKFVNLCREKIGLDVNNEIVDRTHRVDKKEEGAIIVSLKTHKDKLTILRNRRFN